MDWTVPFWCAVIVVARIADVSMGTLRTVMVVTGRRPAAFVLGFFEVLIWITVVGQIVTHLDHWAYYPSYALGFACGTFVGITIERRLAFGTQVIRVFSRNSHEVATALRAMRIGEELPHLAVTEMEARGHKGPVGVLFVEVARRHVEAVARRSIAVDPDAYYIIDDVRRSSSAASRTVPQGWLSRRMVRK